MVQKHRFLRWAIFHQFGQHFLGAGPQRTLTAFAPFAMQRCGRRSIATACALEVRHGQHNRFGDPGPGVVEKLQHCIFNPTERRRAIRRVEQGLHFTAAELVNGLVRHLLLRNRTHLGTPVQMGGFPGRDEACESTNDRQSLIAGLCRAAACFKTGEKLSHKLGAHIVKGQALGRLAKTVASELEQLHESVPAALSGVVRQVAFGHEMLAQKAAQPKSEGVGVTYAHLLQPAVQSGAKPHTAVPGSSSDRPGCRPGWRVPAKWTAPAPGATHRRLVGTSSPPDGRQRCDATNAGWAVVVRRSDQVGLRPP